MMAVPPALAMSTAPARRAGMMFASDAAAPRVNKAR